MATIARPGPPGVPAQAPPVLPNKTLYVRNLPDKLRKPDLKRSLYMLFATYGVILDIIALKTSKMRGQAHIVFRDVDASTQAMRALEGFSFFGKELHISYAKSKSNTFAKLAGTFELPKAIGEANHAKAQEQSEAAKAIFGAAPDRAVPVNEAERAKGTKRGREEEEEKEESDDDDAEMQMSESDSD